MTSPRGSTGVRRLGRVLVVAGGAAIVAACLPQSAAADTRAVNDLYLTFAAAAAVIAAIVWGALAIAVLRSRRTRDAEAEPHQIEGSTRLEVIWTLGPVVTIAALFVLTLAVLGRIEERAPDPAVEVDVAAFRWGWRFTYPDHGIEVAGTAQAPPVAVVPVGQTVRVDLTAVDVVHSWYVPQFLYKQDATPGRVVTFDLLVERPGSYPGLCTEFCGLLHSRMPFAIEAVDATEFETWLSQRAASAP